MPHVALPAPHDEVPPPPPQNPHSHEDVSNASLYVDCAGMAFKLNDAPAACLSEAFTYQAQVISAKIGHGQNAPLWFQLALDALKTELQDSMTALRVELEGSITRIEENLTSVAQISAHSYNMTAADGRHVTFETVPFRDGSNPVVMHHLPALHNTDIIQDLSNEHLRKYYRGYVGPLRNTNRNTRIKGVRKAIGATQ